MPELTYAAERARDTTVGSAPARTLRRRSPLPSGRAVVGGFLVALAALGIFVAYTRAAEGPTTTYVVARHDLVPGQRLTGADLVMLPMELPAVVARQAAFSSTRSVVGATVVGPVGAGELVQGSDVVRKRSGPDELEVAFALESARAVAGRLRPGEEVLAASWARRPTDAETTPYWVRVLEANRARLADPDNPDLLYPGQVLELPPAPPAPGA